MGVDRFAGIREFATVAEAGSFAAAAEALDMTGSALSKTIARLEGRLGVKLMHRTTRRLTLTAEGAEYLATCQRVLAELEGAEAALASGRQEPVGRLRVDLPAAFGRQILHALLGLAARHRHLDLAVNFSERKADLIKEGLDLAVRIGFLDDDPELVARRLGEQRLVIVAAPAYLARRGVPASADELAAHDCIVPSSQGQRASWLLLDAQQDAPRSHEIRPRHEMSDGRALLQATIAGCGLAQLPTWLVNEALGAGALVTVLDPLAGATMPIHALWPRTAYMPTKLRVVIDELVRIAARPGSAFHAGPEAG